MKRISIDDMIGRVYGALIVLRFLDRRDGYKWFLCKCVCGKEVERRQQNLTANTKSCGCLRPKERSGKNIVIDMKGQKVGRLLIGDKCTTAEKPCKVRTGAYWKYVCDCGEKGVASAITLRNGATKSCGCLSREMTSERRTQDDPSAPRLTSARMVFWDYSDGDLLFEEFLELSQMDCFYCGKKPTNYANYFKKGDRLKNSSDFSKEHGEFLYNGLDRQDPNITHNKNNVVPCCKDCNVGKLDHDLTTFIGWFISVYNHSILNEDFNQCLINRLISFDSSLEYLTEADIKDMSISIRRRKTNLPKEYDRVKEGNEPNSRKFEPRISSARRVFDSYRRDAGNITFEQFLDLSQQNCFYCNTHPQNERNVFMRKENSTAYSRDNGTFVYNGLDRISSDGKHDIENVVPCCITCNSAKSFNTQDQFLTWIDRLYNHFKLKDDFNLWVREVAYRLPKKS